MNEDKLKEIVFDIDTWIRVSVWKILGKHTVVIKTTSGSMLLRYLRYDERGPYAHDIIGRISLFKDFTSDQMYVKNWSWAPWCDAAVKVDLPEKRVELEEITSDV